MSCKGEEVTGDFQVGILQPSFLLAEAVKGSDKPENLITAVDPSVEGSL